MGHDTLAQNFSVPAAVIAVRVMMMPMIMVTMMIRCHSNRLCSTLAHVSCC